MENNIALLTAFLMLYCTFSLYRYQEKSLRREHTPYPYIKSLKVHLRKPAEDICGLKWYYYGEQTSETLKKINMAQKSGLLTVIDMNCDKSLETGTFINEIFENKGHVYFSRFKNSDCIIVNAVKEPSSEDIKAHIPGHFIMEYGCGEMHITNFGAMLHNIKLLSLTVHFHDKKTATYFPGKTSEIPHILQPNETLILQYCQITTDFKEAQCIGDYNYLASQPDVYDLFDLRCNDANFSYDKIEIKILGYNIYNEKFIFNIIIEREGEFFVSRTIQEPNFFTKLFQPHKK